jgi:hypothetical protein
MSAIKTKLDTFIVILNARQIKECGALNGSKNIYSRPNMGYWLQDQGKRYSAGHALSISG